MSKSLRLTFISMLACVFQTNLVGYFRISGVAPDMMVVFLALITSFAGPYGGFCVGALMSMFYDASVGYALAINMVAYAFIGFACPHLRKGLERLFKKLKHKSILVMMLICFFFVMLREFLYIGYLFLIGSEQGMITIVRAILCAGYSAMAIYPCSFIVRWIMTWHPGRKEAQPDLAEENPPAKAG